MGLVQQSIVGLPSGQSPGASEGIGLNEGEQLKGGRGGVGGVLPKGCFNQYLQLI
jgi:hypothetical protein